MAVLLGGHQYGLQSTHVGKQSVIFVKLTDSSLKALEEYLRHKSVFHTSSKTPTIQFPTGQHLGKISIPTGNNDKSFAFSLSSNEDAHGPQGSFECRQSTRKGTLESLGPVNQKLQVRASDDTYHRFGQKMEEAKKESEKRTTQLLDRGLTGGKVIRKQHPVKIPPKSRPEHRPSPYGSNSPGGGYHDNRNKMMQKHTTPHPQHGNPELLRRPLRERIIHLLAVRPYKKPELLLRINKDGIREKDKKNITGILKQVAFMKDNTYQLGRHIWNDVTEDWPFYTEQDRQSFRRRKPQNLTPPGSDGSTCSSGHSPSSTHPASPPSTSQLKRSSAAYYDSAEVVASKKKRVSNCVRPPDMMSSRSNGYHEHFVGSRSPNMLVASPHRASPRRIDMKADEDKSSWLPLHASDSVVQQPPPPSRNSPKKFSPRVHSPSLQSSSVNPSRVSSAAPVSTRTPEQPDYVVQFTKITNKDQRTRYKAEFNNNYNKYRLLHTKLDRVSKRFADLEARLKQEPKGSEAHQKLKEKILHEYQANKTNKEYVASRAQFQYLHEKLAHIKKLVHEYDTTVVTPS